MIDHGNNLLSDSFHSSSTAFVEGTQSGSGNAFLGTSDHKSLSFASHAPTDGITSPEHTANFGHTKSYFPSRFGSSQQPQANQAGNQSGGMNQGMNPNMNQNQQNMNGQNQQGVPANPNAPIVFLVPTKGIGGFGGMPKMVQLPSLYSFDMGSVAIAASLRKVGNRILADHYF